MDKLIETIVSAIEDKKGKNIVSLDLSGFDGAICSHFVVCNADSTTQVCAIAAEHRGEGVRESWARRCGASKASRTACGSPWTMWTSWCTFSRPSFASFYKLEELWADAPLAKYEYEE